jgi:hypothetical protein
MKGIKFTENTLSRDLLVKVQKQWAATLHRDYPCLFWRLFVLADKYHDGVYVDDDLASQIGDSAAHAVILLTHEEAFGVWRNLGPKEQAQDLRGYLVQMIGVRLSMKDVLNFARRLCPPTTMQSEVQLFLAEVYLLFRRVPGVH